MEEKEAQACWDFWKCEINDKNECPAYKSDSGDSCWFVAGSKAGNPYCTKLKDMFKTCDECSWFIKLNPNFDKS
jgi:hypothetical protein